MSRVAAMTERYRGRSRWRRPAASERLAGRGRRRGRRLPTRDGWVRAARRRGGGVPHRDAANLFIAETQPWALAKDPAKADRLNGVLAEAAEAVRIAAVLLLPVMPSSAVEILRRMGESDRAWRRPSAIAMGVANGEKRILNEGAAVASM